MQFNGNQLGVSYEGRESMITLLEALNSQKKYKLDTLYLALSLCGVKVDVALLNVPWFRHNESSSISLRLCESQR